jgi:hypothetical protein
LFDEPYALHWKTFWERWYERYGRAKTEPIRSKANVEMYVAKYMTKEWNKDFTNPRVSRESYEREIWWNVKITDRQFKSSKNYSLT